jgi:fumarate hydratase class II
MKTRIERDSMGEMHVPADALYGASTARAVENFPIAKRPLPAAVIHAYGHVKAACARANRDLGKLPAEVADAIIAAADEVAEGKHDAHFPVDVYQTGSGTSTNMNVNEVIASLASKRLSGLAASAAVPRVHPNDHVNMGQSSNDTFPTAMHIAGAMAIHRHLKPALHRLHTDLDRKAQRWDEVVKIGRTHLMDATPIRVGQVFSGYAAQAESMSNRAGVALSGDLQEWLPIGGTAVGTGINTHPEFARRVCAVLSNRLGLAFTEAENHFEGQATKDSFVEAHGTLKTIAVSLSKIANDIRLLGSGPRCGIGELQLPGVQPGSSIMPGKVNPVVCESVMQVCCRVIGNDATITTAGLGGVGSIFELNVAMPVIIDAFLESVTLLTNVTNVFVDRCLAGLEVDRQRCAELVEQSLMMVTPLAAHPKVGYDKAAQIAKRAMAENKTIRQVVREMAVLGDAELDRLLDARRMTEPDPTGPSQ